MPQHLSLSKEILNDLLDQYMFDRGTTGNNIRHIIGKIKLEKDPTKLDELYGSLHKWIEPSPARKSAANYRDGGSKKSKRKTKRKSSRKRKTMVKR